MGSNFLFGPSGGGETTTITGVTTLTVTGIGLGTLGAQRVYGRLINGTLNMWGTVVMGTMAATFAQVSIGGFTLHPTFAPQSGLAGILESDTAPSETNRYSIFFFPANNVQTLFMARRYGPNNTNPLSPINASSIFANNSTISFNVTVPIV